MVFVDSGLKALSTGHLFESYWAAFHPAYAHMLINNPPLYSLICGALIRWTPLGLEGLRLLQAILASGLLAFLLENRRARWASSSGGRPSPEVVFILLITCPYVFRALTILRPDIFIFLIQIWLMVEIWDGTFLQGPSKAGMTGFLVALAGWLHYSAILILPLVLVGVLLRNLPGRQPHGLRMTLLMALTALLCFAPWLVVFLSHLQVWKAMIAATQGAQKYGLEKSWLDYAWPVRWLWAWVPPRLRWAESAWGTSLAYHLWWLSYPALIGVGSLLAWRTRVMGRALLMVFMGALGTWFFVKYSEMWFSVYGLGGAECALMLGLYEWKPRVGAVSSLILATAQAMGTLAFALSTPIPSWGEWHAAEARTQAILAPLIHTGRERIYISSLPDPSVSLLKRWPDLQVTRGIDFYSFGGTYESILPQQKAFLISEPWVAPGHPPLPRAALMDWNQALAKFSTSHPTQIIPVDAGDFRYWILLPREGDARRQPGDAEGQPASPPTHAQP